MINLFGCSPVVWIFFVNISLCLGFLLPFKTALIVSLMHPYNSYGPPSYSMLCSHHKATSFGSKLRPQMTRWTKRGSFMGLQEHIKSKPCMRSKIPFVRSPFSPLSSVSYNHLNHLWEWTSAPDIPHAPNGLTKGWSPTSCISSEPETIYLLHWDILNMRPVEGKVWREGLQPCGWVLKRV